MTGSGAGQVGITRNVPYGATKSLVLDVYRKPTATNAPVVMLIHGGGWSDGDKDKFDDESTSLAKAGFVVFDINYTLETGSGSAYPLQVNEVHSALTWVQGHAAKYGGDVNRIGVLGGSAGGYLAAMLAYQADTATANPVKVMVALSGPMDVPAVIAGLRSAVRKADGTCEPVSCDMLAGITRTFTTLLGCNPVDCPDALATQASPTTYVTEYSPPTFLANGTLETVSPDQSASIAKLLDAQGVPVVTKVVPGDFHSVQLLPAIGADLLQFLTVNLADLKPTPTAPSITPTPTSDTPIATPVGDGNRRIYRWVIFAGVIAVLVLVVVVRRLRRDAPPA